MKISIFKFALFWVCLALMLPVRGWYLPGSAPMEYGAGDSVNIKVNALTSVKTQLPFRYYHLPFCQPDVIVDSTENLGEILTGQYVESSPYELKMLEPKECALLCVKKLNNKQFDVLKTSIDDEYVINLSADNLPAALKYTVLSSDGSTEDAYQIGYPVGYVQNKKYFVNNHLSMKMKYHPHDKGEGVMEHRIVGFEIIPMSRTRLSKEGKFSCTGDELPIAKDSEIVYTYDVEWIESDIRWATRWDETYLKRGDTDIHWFSIINSLMIVLFLSGMIAMILLRTLLRDIARYNQLDNLEEAQEESGWKLVHGDVFRRPNHSKLLAVCAGSGVQILGMTCVTILFAVLGLLSPSNRGALLQSVLLLFTFMGFPAGFVSAKLNKLFEGDDTSRSFRVTLMTSLLFPGFTFCIFFVLDLLIWSQKSTGAVPFGTMFLLLILWFGISLPLVFIGSYFGYKSKPVSLPVRTNQIPRQIPPQHWATNIAISCLVGGVLPFGAVFTELLFIMSSIWQHQYYYLFGFLSLVLLILVITCAEISIAFTYFQLAGESYQWWWRSFWCSASSALYVFLYAVLYFVTRLSITRFVSMMLYFGYMFIISYAFMLLTGTVGFISTFIFVRAIYGSIKVD